MMTAKDPKLVKYRRGEKEQKATRLSHSTVKLSAKLPFDSDEKEHPPIHDPFTLV
jgi:hypothetical protein